MSQGPQEETAAYRLMEKGFSGFKDENDGDWAENRCVLVNFLDPGATTSISSRSAQDSSNKDAKKQQPKSLLSLSQQRQSLIERFQSTFREQYGNRLSQVSYQDPRSKTTTKIPFVNVKCRFLQSQVDLLRTHEEDVVDTDGSTTNALHSRPYCYVYFVTGCQTLDDYRNKTKPAIQVFLSQLDDLYQRQAMQLSSTTSAASLNSGMSGGEEDQLPAYLLVYCPSRAPGSTPILPPELDGDGIHGATGGGQRAFSLANRFRDAMVLATTAAASESETATTTSGGSSEHAAANGSTATPTTAGAGGDGGTSFNPLSVLTKVEKELAKRMAMDFPRGTVATLTTLGNDYHSNFTNSSIKDALEELERQEWNCLLQALSKTVVHGFDTISNGLLFALRRISNQRTSPDRANIGRYFLMKESLAFTYEQMNLPAEALLQYKELRAFLPDLSKALEMQAPHPEDEDLLEGIDGAVPRHKSKDMGQLPVTPIWDVPEMSTTAFRKHIQGLHHDDYYLVAPATELYLWERESSLLFHLGNPVRVLKKTGEFCVALYQYQKQAQPFSQYIRDKVEEWAFGFCWDVKRAAQGFLVQQHETEESATKRQKAAASASMEIFGRHLTDLVDFMRIRFLTLADLKQDATQKQGPSTAMSPKYQDIVKPWEPWKPSSASKSLKDINDEVETKNSLDMSGKTFLSEAFGKDRQNFLLQYMEVLRVYISLCNFCGQHRSAARLTMELVDLHVELAQIPQASRALQSVAKVYARDGWNAEHFFVHFRLAGFRRSSVGPRDYLATLVHCFSRHNNANPNKHGGMNINTPQKALELLCQDFEAVMALLSKSERSEERDITFFNSPIFEAGFRNPDSKTKRVLSRKLPRKLYSVGDKVQIIFVVKSHLPRELDGVDVTASLVPHKTYISAQKHKKALGLKDMAYQINLPGGVAVRPGENVYALEWTPPLAGQFVLFQITVTYKSTNFVYTHDRMKELGFWMDILPLEPTQSMMVKPLFLVPGHEQRLQIEFRSGEDHVESGELNLVCSPGLALLPPEEEGVKWSTTLKLALKECPPGGTQNFSVLVTGASTQTLDENETMSTGTVMPTVHAKITTMFRCGTVDGEESAKVTNKIDKNTSFQHEMEAVIPTLGDTALTVGDVSLNSYGKGKVILSVAARCHVPAPYVLKNWHLELPSYLQKVESSEDMNKAATDSTLVMGETMNFAFNCSAKPGSETKSHDHWALVVALLDEYDSAFEERLLLRLKRRAALPAMTLPETVYQLSLVAKLSCAQGPVGVPVQVTYTLETTAFEGWTGNVSYTVDVANDAWLVAGSTQGNVELIDGVKEWKLTFYAIPTRPGAIEKTPFMELKFTGGGLESPHHMVLAFANISSPCFKAWLPADHSTIAVPVC